MKNQIRVTACMCVFLMLFTFVLATGTASAQEAPHTKWAIYWYLCGSDLESNGGAATNDLIEMLEIELPEGVQVIIQTGGANEWHNEIVRADRAQRYLYDAQGLQLIEEFDVQNMGDPNTLQDFLSFAKENYPAEHTMVSFWNHGGGSITGVAFDEQFNFDSLTVLEMRSVFGSLYMDERSVENQPISIIGFDTCLMATMEVAYYFWDTAEYLVASQELEPGNGWNYTGIMQALAENPDISPLDLSIAICDTYKEGCEQYGTADNITLSVVDLERASVVFGTYEQFGKGILNYAMENPSFFASFAQIAKKSENYGGNTREQGYANMVDFGHLATLSADYVPYEAEDALKALDFSVVYKVNGPYRKNAHGISCYYSYNGNLDELQQYNALGSSEGFRHFFELGLTGELGEEGVEYVSALENAEIPEIQTLENTGWDNIPLTVNDEGCAVVTLGAQANDILSSLTYDLYYVDVEEDLMISLGTDNDIEADWENGIFADNFRGVWGSIDGELCYMELSFEGEDYNEYSVPIMLNDEEYNLMVIYDFIEEEFFVVGARKPIYESGAADKLFHQLEEGDVICPIHYGTLLSEESDELIPVAMDPIVYYDGLSFYETELGDGTFYMMYQMTDYQNNICTSDVAKFEIVDGEIFTTVE